LGFSSRFRIDPQDRRFLPELREALVRELYRRGVAASFFFLPISLLLWLVEEEAYHRSAAVRTTYSVLLAAIGLRFCLVLLVPRFLARESGPRARFLVYLGSSLLISGSLATLTVLSYPLLSPISLAVLTVWQTGVNSIGMVSFAASPLHYFCFILPNLGSLLVLLFLFPKAGLDLLFMLLLVYVVALAVMSLIVHLSLRNGFLQGFQLSELALRDSLTGLRNRRYLMEFMPGETARILRAWTRAAAGEGPACPPTLGLMVFDIDHFKAINDAHGHAAGDAVLQQLAQLLSTPIIRRSDFAVRCGGDEFILVAVHTERPPLALAERIRECVAAHRFQVGSGETLQVTFSLGYSVFPLDPARPALASWEQVLEIADLALYQAKRCGKNRSVGIACGVRPIEDPEALLARLQTNPEESLLDGYLQTFE